VSAEREGAAVVGIGAAACAVCCAGPILGFLATLGLGTAAGFVLLGVAGALIAVSIGALWYLRRRRRRSTCAPAPEVVAVDLPRLPTASR